MVFLVLQSTSKAVENLLDLTDTEMADFHIAMFPWLAIGHMTPYIHLANELASRGHRISILVPTKTLLKLKHLILHPSLIILHPLTVPKVDGLPPGAETTCDIPLYSNHLLASALDLMRDQVEGIISSAKPDLVVYDFAYWIPDITKKFGTMKSVCYHIVSATALAYSIVPARNVPKDRPLTEEEVRIPPPGFPSSAIALRGDEVKKSILLLSAPPIEGKISFFERLKTSMENCDALSIRTCRELDGKFCDYIGTQYGKPLLLTGSVLPEAAPAKTLMLEDKWDKWLSRFERGSVVFCAFGSQSELEKDQFQELVLGFELTGLPFFIALRPPAGCTTMEEALPEGFEERVKGRGVVYGGWVQQPLILSHRSVGCFVSHCGFGSMWEGLMSDNQIVLVPQLGDHTLSTRLLVEELKVAVEVYKEDKGGWFSKESLSRAVKSVMDKSSEVGIMVKKNHGKLKDDLAKPGLMSGYCDKFVEDLRVLVNQC